MKEAIKDFIGKVPLQLWSSRQFAQYSSPDLDIRGIQNYVLARIQNALCGSQLAQHYGLAGCADIEDLRKQIPLLEYNDFLPYIEAAMAGDFPAMFARHVKLQMFALSSGTTGPRKYVPITNKVVSELKRSWRLWGTHFYSDHPDLLDCPITQITSSGLSGKTSGGVPYGDLSGFLAEIQPWYVSNFYTVPLYASNVTNQNLKYYTFLRIALANRGLRIITTASPATLLRVAELARTEQASLIRDFHDGGISCTESDTRDVPKLLAQRLAHPDKETARFLEDLSKRDAFEPRHYWPDLKVLACWTGGTMGHYKPALQDVFGDVVFRDLGLASSEAHVTIPYADNQSDGLLNLYSNVFEFIEQGRSDQTVFADQLQKGKIYEVVVSGLNGLLRYRTHDQVICTDHLGKWPLLRFYNKGDYICDLTGEKLSAYHVSKAVERVSSETGLRLNAFVVAPNKGFPRGYRLLVEKGRMNNNDLMRTFIRKLDLALGQENFIYQEHREAEKLAPLDYKIVEAGTITEWHAQRLMTFGGSLEQYKPPCLIVDADRLPLRVS